MRKAREFVELYKETLKKEAGFEVLAQKAVIKAFVGDISQDWEESKHNKLSASRILSKADETWRKLATLLSWIEPDKFNQLMRAMFPEAWVLWQMNEEEEKHDHDLRNR